MSDESFHHTKWWLDKAKVDKPSYCAGDVIRLGDWAFADAVILGFNNDGDALLHRPYLYAGSIGTTGPVPLLGSERAAGRPIDRKSVNAGIHSHDGGQSWGTD